jgi:hypothetical protein
MPDEKGVYVLINPNGSKYFRYKYLFAGKERLLALGAYPETSLKKAREKRDEARKQLAEGIACVKIKRLLNHRGLKLQQTALKLSPVSGGTKKSKPGRIKTTDPNGCLREISFLGSVAGLSLIFCQ